jgi:hypothetical protein
MEIGKEQIEKMVIKLKVLENKILHLETITNEVLDEVELAYHDKIKELYLKRDEAQQKLKKIQETKDHE